MIGLALLGGAAAAQTVDDQDVPATALDLPRNPTIIGKLDPNVHKATAIVNGDVITETDVDQRLALVVAANGGTLPEEERQEVRQQIVRNLIDESLEIQEAKANEISVTSDEIDQSFNRVSGNFKQRPEKFAAYLKSIGSSEHSMRRQIEGELAWRRLLSRRVEPFVNIGDEEVKSVMSRLEAAKGKPEYHVFEIYLSATPDTAAAVQANADRIVTQLRQGAAFQAYARQYSEASTAAVGGDLGWVRAETLPQPMAEAVSQMSENTISQPITIPGGYTIIALAEKRQVLGVDQNDALLSLKQITVKFPAGMTQDQAAPTVENFAKAMKTVTGCGAVEKVAATVGGEVVQNDNIRFGSLPPFLQSMMGGIQIGQATPPFGSVKDGVRSLVLCGRDDPTAGDGPSFTEIYNQIEQERVAMRARRYLRDLRRDAVVDYR